MEECAASVVGRGLNSTTCGGATAIGRLCSARDANALGRPAAVVAADVAVRAFRGTPDAPNVVEADASAPLHSFETRAASRAVILYMSVGALSPSRLSANILVLQTAVAATDCGNVCRSAGAVARVVLAATDTTEGKASR